MEFVAIISIIAVLSLVAMCVDIRLSDFIHRSRTASSHVYAMTRHDTRSSLKPWQESVEVPQTSAASLRLHRMQQRVRVCFDKAVRADVLLFLSLPESPILLS